MLSAESSHMEDLHALVRQSRQEQQLITEKLTALETIAAGSWPTAPGSFPSRSDLHSLPFPPLQQPGGTIFEERYTFPSVPAGPRLEDSFMSPLPRVPPRQAPLDSARGQSPPASPDLNTLFSKFDTNHDGQLSRQEFNKGISERQGHRADPLKESARSDRPERHGKADHNTAVVPPPSSLSSPSLTAAAPQMTSQRAGMVDLLSNGAMAAASAATWRRGPEEWRALQAQIAGMDHAMLERDHEIEKLRREVAKLRSTSVIPASPPSRAVQEVEQLRSASQPTHSDVYRDRELAALRSRVGQLEAEASVRDAQRKQLFEDASSERSRGEAADRQRHHLQQRLEGLEAGFARCINRVTSALAAGVVRVSVKRADPVSRFALLRIVPPTGSGVLELYQEPDDVREAASFELRVDAVVVSLCGFNIHIDCAGGPVDLQCTNETDLRKWHSPLSLFQEQTGPSLPDLRSQMPQCQQVSASAEFSPMHRSNHSGSVVMPYGEYARDPNSPRNPARLCGEGVPLLPSRPLQIAEAGLGPDIARPVRPLQDEQEEQQQQQVLQQQQEAQQQQVLQQPPPHPPKAVAATTSAAALPLRGRKVSPAIATAAQQGCQLAPSTCGAAASAPLTKSPCQTKPQSLREESRPEGAATSPRGGEGGARSGISSFEGWFAEYGSPAVMEEAASWPSFRRPLEVWPPADVSAETEAGYLSPGVLVDEASSHRLLRAPGPPELEAAAAARSAAPVPMLQRLPPATEDSQALPPVELFPGEQAVLAELNDILERADVNRSDSLTKSELGTLRDSEYSHFAAWVTDSRRFPAFDQNRSGAIERQELARALWIYKYSPEGGSADALPGGDPLLAATAAQAYASGADPRGEPFMLGGSPMAVGRSVHTFQAS